MLRWFAFLFLVAALPPVVGCGLTGESTMDAMKRRAKGQAEANKAAEERAKQKAAKAPKTAVSWQPAKDPDDQELPLLAEKTAGKNSPAKPSTAKDATAKTKIAAAPPLGSKASLIRPSIPAKPELPLTEIQRRNKSATNLEQIVGALNKYAREKGAYPTQAITSRRLGRPLLSWRVTILPYLGLGDFYQEFKLEEPWDSPHNLALLKHIPPAFVSPERYDEKTNYLAPHGPGTAWHGIRGKDPLSFADGADTTLIVIEADESSAVPWTKPDDLVADGKLKTRLGKLRGEGFLATFANGYVAMIHNKVTDGQLSWMISTDGEDFLADRTIIFDATVPDVALVTDQPKRDEGNPDDPAGDKAKQPGDKAKAAVASSAKSSAVERPGELPAVKLPPPPKRPVRLPVPPDEELAKAREQLREIFHEEYKQSKSKGERQRVAVKMLGDAPRLENDAAAYHELLQTVRQIAVQAGDIGTALKAVELMETKLELPPLLLRLQTLDELTGAVGESSQGAGQLAAEAEKVFVSAYEGDDYPTALEAHRIHMGMLRQNDNRNDRWKTAKAAAYRPLIEEAQRVYKLVPAALSALATNAENTEANGVAGKYFCLVKEQWEVGLPMLARGPDLKLRILARMDLEKGKSGPETVQLADQYWELAQDYKQPQRRSLELRAAFHYAGARGFLMPGVDLVKAEKRIEEANRLYGSGPLAKTKAGAPLLPMPTVNPKDDSD